MSLAITNSLCTAGSAREGGRIGGSSLGRLSTEEDLTTSLSICVAYVSELVESGCVSSNGCGWKGGLESDSVVGGLSEEQFSCCGGSTV